MGVPAVALVSGHRETRQRARRQEGEPTTLFRGEGNSLMPLHRMASAPEHQKAARRRSRSNRRSHLTFGVPHGKPCRRGCGPLRLHHPSRVPRGIVGSSRGRQGQLGGPSVVWRCAVARGHQLVQHPAPAVFTLHRPRRVVRGLVTGCPCPGRDRPCRNAVAFFKADCVPTPGCWGPAVPVTLAPLHLSCPPVRRPTTTKKEILSFSELVSVETLIGVCRDTGGTGHPQGDQEMTG